ncbi:hypothetical protein [Metallosphaera tengchongensis]|nr:hypothetical protein [Metallosphaera tengchongensis]
MSQWAAHLLVLMDEFSFTWKALDVSFNPVPIAGLSSHLEMI